MGTRVLHLISSVAFHHLPLVGMSHHPSNFQPPSQPQSHFSQLQAQLQAQSLANAAAAAAAKRGQLRPPVRPPLVAPPMAFKAAEYAAAAAAAAAKKKKRRPYDKQIPERLAALLPESALYTQLLEFESRVDAALMRRKIDIQEAMKNPPFMQRTLRIYVFNTYANQTNQARTAPRKQQAEPPSWTLKIVGQILEDGPEVDNSGIAMRPTQYPKFSSFFKRVTIALDPNLYPENPAIIWENSRSPAQHEGFEIKRKGDKEFNVSIRFEMNYIPEKFKLSQALTDVLGIEVETRARIISGIWQYVKAKKLQSPIDPSFFVCDLPLMKVFGEERVRFAMVSQKITPHLSPPQPIHLEHRIRLSGNSPAGNACYDVLVDIPFPVHKEMAAFLANTEKHREIDACEEAISSVLRRIHEHRKRRAFFLGFSQSPVEFINALLDSQSRDLKLLAGESNRNPEQERRSEFYNQPWVEDAVIRYLNRKPPPPPSATAHEAPSST